MYASEPAIVPAYGRVAVSTGIAVATPKGCYGSLRSRSGIALKQGVEVGAGVIDPDYRGEVKVLLYNRTDEPFVVRATDRIAQLICECFVTADVRQVKNITDLGLTARADKGFGSTGVSKCQTLEDFIAIDKYEHAVAAEMMQAVILERQKNKAKKKTVKKSLQRRISDYNKEGKTLDKKYSTRQRCPAAYCFAYSGKTTLLSKALQNRAPTSSWQNELLYTLLGRRL